MKLAMWTQQNTVDLKKAETMTSEELGNKIIVGEYIDVEKPSLVDRYAELFEKAKRS